LQTELLKNPASERREGKVSNSDIHKCPGKFEEKKSVRATSKLQDETARRRAVTKGEVKGKILVYTLLHESKAIVGGEKEA